MSDCMSQLTKWCVPLVKTQISQCINSVTSKFMLYILSLTLYLIKRPFNTFANRADPDQAALVRAA